MTTERGRTSCARAPGARCGRNTEPARPAPCGFPRRGALPRLSTGRTNTRGSPRAGDATAFHHPVPLPFRVVGKTVTENSGKSEHNGAIQTGSQHPGERPRSVSPGSPSKSSRLCPRRPDVSARAGWAYRLKTLSLKAYFSRRVRGGRWPWPGMSRNAVALMLSQSGPQSSKPSEREDRRSTRECAAVTSHTWASQHTCPFPSHFQLQPENWKLDDSPKTKGRRPHRGTQKQVCKAAHARRRPRSPRQTGKRTNWTR